MRAGRFLAAALLALACAGAPPFELPEERGAGQPLSESPNLRTGEITWRSGRLETTPEGVRFEFTLMNGTARDYAAMMLRLVLRGPDRKLATVRYPVGSLSRGSRKVVSALLASPGFEVEETQIELIWAQQ
jgi:hypothetical protein